MNGVDMVLIAIGYVFQMEVVVRAKQHGYTVGEVCTCMCVTVGSGGFDE